MRAVVAKACLAKAWRDALFKVVPRALCKPIEAETRKLAAGDHAGACRAMAAWTYITVRGQKVNCRTAGKLCRGIVIRRDEEVSRCLEAL